MEGSQNQDSADSCSECGTGILSASAREGDAQLRDPLGASVLTCFVVVVPILSGVLVHLNMESNAMGPLFWLWAVLSVGCFVWGRFTFRKYRSLAWCCVAVGMLQLIVFL